MSVRHAAVALGVVCLLATSPAVGQAPAQANKPAYDPRTAFGETDTNHDGAVDHGEFNERMTEVFYHADSDKDGGLSTTEIRATLVETDNLSAADTNRDGKTTLHEFTRARAVDYEQTDTNDNGLLEVDEVVTVYEKVKK
jgi:hypothetical protein